MYSDGSTDVSRSVHLVFLYLRPTLCALCVLGGENLRIQARYRHAEHNSVPAQPRPFYVTDPTSPRESAVSLFQPKYVRHHHPFLSDPFYKLFMASAG